LVLFLGKGLPTVVTLRWRSGHPLQPEAMRGDGASGLTAAVTGNGLDAPVPGPLRLSPARYFVKLAVANS